MNHLLSDDKNSLPVYHKNLLDWYFRNQRKLPWRQTINPYYIWVSEVMLQQTQVITVLPYYNRFIRQYPDVEVLASASLQDVLKCWEGLGYYARARNLHKAAKVVISEFDAKIPDHYQDFRSLPGVGEYIAAAVLSIAFNLPYPVTDGNVKRVLARLLLLDSPVNKPQGHKVFLENSRQLFDPMHPGAYNQAVMELGALICKPVNPDCCHCPVADNCRAYTENRQTDFPIRHKTSGIPEYHVSAGVIYRQDKILITKRDYNSMLGGLWEFPGGRINKGESPEAACLREIEEEVGLQVRIRRHLTRIHHAYTHFKIVLDVFICDYISGEVKLNGPIDFTWITPYQLAEYPLPGANRKFIPQIYQMMAEGTA